MVRIFSLMVTLIAMSSAPALASDLYERVREASGSPTSSAGIHLTGDAFFVGEECDFELQLSGTGLYRREFRGPISLLTVDDGSPAWERDWSNTVRTLAMADLEKPRFFTWLTSGYWLREPTAFDVVEGEAPNTLELTLRGGIEGGTLWIDPQTLLPARLVQIEDEQETITTFAKYERLGELLVPMHVETTNPVGELTWVKVSNAGPLDASEFGEPWSRPTSTPARFEPGLDLVTQVAPTGHLLVQVRVNGHEPGWFIFDTGAGGHCISSTVPYIDELQKHGQQTVGGVGGSVTAPYRVGSELQIGPVTMDEPWFIELDLAFLEGPMNARIDGIVGFDLLSRCVADIDLPNGVVELFDPQTYELSGAKWEKLVLASRHPSVRAQLEGGRSGQFKIDTGAAGSTVTFHAPYVESSGLLLFRDTDSSTSGGVAGTVETRSGEISSFELGGHRFEDVFAEFALEHKGAFANKYTAGNIGGQLLKPFRLVLNYPRETLAFVPRGPQ